MTKAIIDLQDKIQREGKIRGKEVITASRQLPKRALVEIADLSRFDGARNPQL